MVNSPNNPTGAVYDAEAMAEFAAIAEEYDALLLSDEVYDHFDFAGDSERTHVRFRPRHRHFRLFEVDGDNGLPSRVCGLPARTAPLGHCERARTQPCSERHREPTSAVRRPAGAEDDESGLLRRLPTATRKARRRLCAALAAAGAEYNRPDGGFYVMARFPDFPGSFENVYELIDEAGVAGMPGEPSASPVATGSVRARDFPGGEAAQRLATTFGSSSD